MTGCPPRGGELLRATHRDNDILKFHLSRQVRGPTSSGNGTSTAPQGLGSSDWVHQLCLEGQDQKILRLVPPLGPSGNSTATAPRGNDQKILCLPAEEVPTSQAKWHGKSILLGVSQQRRSHLSSQAAMLHQLLFEAMTRRSSVHQQRRSHFSGQAAWYINPP